MKHELLKLMINPVDRNYLDNLLRGEPEEFTRMFGAAPIMIDATVPAGCVIAVSLYQKEVPPPAGNIYYLPNTQQPAGGQS